MKRSLVLIFFCLALAANSFAEDATEPIVPGNRIDLFNGTNFANWKFVMRSNAAPEETWTIGRAHQAGVIYCTGRPAGYARTEKSYRDYKLTVEWRFVTVAPKADNSGIFLHINPPDKVWPTCIEAQGQHNHQGDLRMNGGATAKNHDTAETRGASAQNPSNENPPGEWNTLEAECSGSSIKLWINGKLMNDITECSVSSGAIGLQSEGGEIEIRKIFLEPLKR